MKNNRILLTMLLLGSVSLQAMRNSDFQDNYEAEQIAADEAFARQLAQELGEDVPAAAQQVVIEPQAAPVVVEPQAAPVVEQAEIIQPIEMLIYPSTVYVSPLENISEMRDEIEVLTSCDTIARQLEALADTKRLAEQPVHEELLRLTLMRLINGQVMKYRKASFEIGDTARKYSIVLPKHNINEANLVQDPMIKQTIDQFIEAALPSAMIEELAPLNVSLMSALFTKYSDWMQGVSLAQNKIDLINEFAQIVELIGRGVFGATTKEDKVSLIESQRTRLSASKLPSFIKTHLTNVITVALKTVN